MRTSARASRRAATMSTGSASDSVDRLAVVLAETVVGHATLHGHAERRDVGDLDRVVLGGADGLGQVEADLLRVDVERGDELDVADVVVAELHVHETGHGAARRRRRRSSARPGRATRRSCRRRRWRRGWRSSSLLLGGSRGGDVVVPSGVCQQRPDDRCLQDGCGEGRARCRSARRASGPHARPVRGRAAGARGCTRPCARGCGRRTGGPSRDVRSGACADPRGSAAGSRRRSARRRRTGRRSSRPPRWPGRTTRAPAGGAPCRRRSAGRRCVRAWTPRCAVSTTDSVPWIQPRSTSDFRHG